MRTTIIQSTKIFLILLILGTFPACGPDGIVKRCYYGNVKHINELMQDYDTAINNARDSEGNWQSLEACLLRRDITLEYKGYFEDERYYFRNNRSDYLNQGCTQEEIDKILVKLEGFIDDLNRTMDEIYNHCEEEYP